MKNIKVTFQNNDAIKTCINGTKEEIEKYYLNRYFNLGKESDNMQKAIKVEFIKNN